MHKTLESLLQATAVVAAMALAGCSDASTGTSAVGEDAGCPTGQAGCPAKDAGCAGTTEGCPAVGATNAGTADLPATGSEAEVKAWLATGDYTKGTWKCEAEPHAARSPSPHGMNRVCSNATLSAHGAGEYPVGSAGVKELYDGEKIIGRAMYRKLSAGGGDTWYWYEDLNGSVVANNVGVSGTEKNVCVGCHTGAGSDAEHSGHDFVYTQVK